MRNPAGPEFSVIVASYNHAPYVAEAVGSALAQCQVDLEVVAVDDGSSDGSMDVLQELAAGDARLRVHQHPEGANLGAHRTVRRAVELSRGRFLAFLDSDDRWLPGRLARQAGPLRLGAALVYGNARVIDAAGRPLAQERGRPMRGRPLETLLWSNPVPFPTACFPRQAYEAVGGYSTDAVYDDLHLWLRLATRGPVVHVDQFLADYRVVPGSMDQGITHRRQDLRGYGEAVHRLASWPGLPADDRMLVESWSRCWEALLRLVDGDEGCLSVLWPDDARHAFRLFRSRRQRLVEMVGPDLGARWAAALPAASPPVRRALRWALPPRPLDPAGRVVSEFLRRTGGP